MVDDLLADGDVRMGRSVESLRHQLGLIRTGRASATLVEELLVDAYGAPAELKTLATITVPEARLLVIHPWDKTLIAPVIQALEKSDIGITPASDGTVVRLPFPPLSTERRRAMVRVVSSKIEDGRIAVRNIRRHIADDIRTAESEKMCSADEAHRALTRLDGITHSNIELMEAQGKAKEAEVLEI